MFAEWSVTTKAANFSMLTSQGYMDSWSRDVNKDLSWLPLAISAASLYVILFLGFCSPIHCRCKLAIAGIISVVLSFFSGFGLLYYIGKETSTFHLWLPFISMFVGVEHMFNLCNAVDQTGLHKDSFTRIHIAISHAGPAMTITSLTMCLAFLSGMLFTHLEALQSFCLFATVNMAMLYLNSMTLFLAVLVWDTQRVEKHEKDCFNLCCIDEDSAACCWGHCAYHKRGEYKFRVENLEQFGADWDEGTTN